MKDCHRWFSGSYRAAGSGSPYGEPFFLSGDFKVWTIASCERSVSAAFKFGFHRKTDFKIAFWRYSHGIVIVMNYSDAAASSGQSRALIFMPFV